MSPSLGGAVGGLGGEAKLVGDGGVDLVEGVAFAGADVEDTAGGDPRWARGRRGGWR